MSNTDILLVEERGQIAILTLNRPQVQNAISKALAEKLEAAIRAIARRRDLRVVIITGAGDRAFSAGTDLKERRELDADGKWEQAGALRKANDAIWSLPKPVIAAIQGWCLGGGYEIALNCDIRIASKTAVFSWPEMQLGVGRARAKELFFTARKVKAEEALELGIIERLTEPGEHLTTALAMAQEIISNSSPLGAAAVKQMVNLGSEMSVAEAHVLNDLLRRPLEGTKDYEEGIRAFFEKRQPVWQGE